MERLRFSNVVTAGLITEIPVAAGLALWIWSRADDLVRLSRDLDPGFLVPTTTAEAVVSGYIIWAIVSVACGLLACSVYSLLSRKWHWRPIHFGALVVGLAALVSTLAFVSGMVFAVEAAGEMLIVALGFGVLMPWLARGRSPARPVRNPQAVSTA